MDIARAVARATVAIVEVVLSRTALTATAFDHNGFEGSALFILEAGAPTAGSAQTLDVKLQHSDTSGGTYADIPGAVFGQVTTAAAVKSVAVDMNGVKQFIKAVATFGGTTPTYPFGITIVGVKKYN